MNHISHFGIAGLLMSAIAVLPSCVADKTYDLNNMDTEVTLLKGVEMPFPSIKEIKLKDFIDVQKFGGVLSVNEEGAFVLSVKMSPTEVGGFSIDKNAIAMNVNGNAENTINLGVASVPANTPLKYNKADAELLIAALGLSSEQLNVLLSSDFLNQSVDYEFSADFSVDNLPSQIKAIKSANLAGNLSLGISMTGVPFSKVVLKAGTKLVFPSFLQFNACSNNQFELVNAYTLQAKSDIPVYIGTGSGKGLDLSLTLAKLDFGEGLFPEGGALPLKSSVSISGTATLDPMDFTGEKYDFEYPVSSTETHTATLVKNETPIGNITMGYSYSAAVTSLSDVTLMVSDDAAPKFDKSYGFDVPELPEILSGADISVGLTDVEVTLGLDSNLPFDFGLAGMLKSMTGEVENHLYAVGPLTFEKNTKTNWVLYDGGEDRTDSETYRYHHVEDLGKILTPVPTRIEAESFSVMLPQEWMTIETGKSFGGSFEVGLNAPLAFTSDTHLMAGINISMELKIPEAVPQIKARLGMTVTNTIPMQLEVDIKMLGEDEKPIDGMKFEVSDPIAPGTPANPATSNLSADLMMNASETIKGLRIDFHLSSNDYVAGTPLSPEQGIQLSDLYIGFPDGITADIKDITKNSENSENNQN